MVQMSFESLPNYTAHRPCNAASKISPDTVVNVGCEPLLRDPISIDNVIYVSRLLENFEGPKFWGTKIQKGAIASSNDRLDKQI